MRRLDRYILAETVGPLALGFGVYTFIMLVRLLFRSAELIIRRGLSAREVGEVILLNLPNIVVLTLPMALLFGILIAIGRLASDSELIAMRSSGLSLFVLYRPILVLSLVLTLGNTFLMAWLLPRANHRLSVKMLEILAQTASRQVEPRVFYEEWEGLVLYVFEIAPGGDVWEGVFVAPSVPQGESAITVADRGRLRIDERGERVVLSLENAVTHKVDLVRPGRYETIGHDRVDIVLEDTFTSSQRAKISASKGVRELTLTELGEWARDAERSEEVRRLARVEIHKKFSIPAACLVFGLFAVPLGFNNRRGGKSSGFALSILVILAYYVLLNNGEEAARVGKLPPSLAMWLPNLVFTALGTFLLARRNRDKSLLLWRFDVWLRIHLSRAMQRLRHQHRERREARARAVADRRKTPDVVLRIPRFSMRFPNLLDRYVIALFAKVFLLVVLSGVTLYVLADLTDNADEILDNKPPVAVVATYYGYLTLQIFFDIAPILVLVTTLLTYALLSRTNEVTACRALGISLYRLAIPAVAAAGLVALASAGLQVEVLPASNQKVAELKDRMKGRGPARTYRRLDRQWLFGRDGEYIFNYLFYDRPTGVIDDLQVFHFGPDHALVQRAFVDVARWTGDQWLLEGGWVRSFGDSIETAYRPFEEPRPSPYAEPPSYFGAEERRPEQMHAGELRRYIRELERRGRAAPELHVALQNKLAFPALSVVMALVALPFAFRLGRRGALYGVGLSLVLGMVLMGVFAIFSKLGEVGTLPAVAAVWGPSLVFAVFSLYLFLGVKT